jgi:Protein of unknown function (DUF3263)
VTAASASRLELTAWERDCLDHELWYWRQMGAKEDAIRLLFRMTPVTYYRRLNLLLDTERALAAEPVLVNRLRRIRDSRRVAREARLAMAGTDERDPL